MEWINLNKRIIITMKMTKQNIKNTEVRTNFKCLDNIYIYEFGTQTQVCLPITSLAL